MKPNQHNVFETLIRAYYRALTRYVKFRCSPADVDEVLSMVLETAWKRFNDRPLDAERGWLMGIALNCVRNVTRSNTRRAAALRQLGDMPRRGAVGLYDIAVSAETRVALKLALEKLSDKDREIILLAAIGGLAGADLAAAVAADKNTATVRLHRARTRLRKLYEDSEKS